MKSQSRHFIDNIGSRFLILAFAVLIFLGGISLQQARKALIESTFEKLKIAITIKEDVIKIWFRQEKASFLLISQLAEVSNYTEILLDKDSSNQEKIQAKRKLSDRFKQILEFQNNWSNISILALNGEVILGTDPSLEGKIISINKLNYYDVSTSRDRINPIFYQSEFTGKPTVTLGVPLFNSAKKQIALLTTNLNLKQLASIVGKPTGLGATEKIHLVSLLQGNPTLISQDSQALDSNFNSWLLKNINTKNNSQKIYYNSQKKPIIGLYQSLNDQNIVLIAEINQAEALVPAQKLARTIIFFAIVSIGILYRVIRHFTKALKSSRWQQEKQQKQLEQEVIEKRKVAQALARGNVILSAQQETSIDGILILDERQHIIAYNQRFIDLWQIKQSFPIGSSGESLLAYLTANLQNSTYNFQQNITTESYQEVLLEDGRFFEVYSNVIDTQQTNYGSIFYFRDITSRKSCEQEIENTHQFLLHILNTIPDPIFVKDEEHRWLLVNDALCEFLGHSREELIGKSDYDFFPPQEAEVFWEKDNLVFATGMTYANEEHLTDSDGVEHIIATHKAVFQNVDNGYTLVGAIRDITQLKQTEAKLKESEAFLTLIINTVPQAIFWKDRQSVFLGCNQTFAIAAGLEHPGQVIGKTDSDFPWSEEETKWYLECDRYCIQQEKPLYNIAETHTKADGKQINIEVSKVPLRNLKGEVIGVLGTYEDVSEQKKRAEFLRLIVEGTASKIGRDFFQSCVKTLANILDVNYALVTTFDNNNQAEIMALWEDGNLTSNSQFEFSQTFLIQLKNTKEVIHYSLTDQDLLPRHDSLKSFTGANFLGIAIANASGDTLGYLAIADSHRLLRPTRTEPAVTVGQSLGEKLEEAKLILQILAARASAELQRKYAQDALEHQLQRANLLAKITQQIRSNLRIEDVFQATVDSIGQAFAVSRCHLITCQKATVSSSQIVAEYCLAGYVSLLDVSIPPESNPYIEKVLTQDRAVASANVDQEPLLRQQKQFSHQIELKSILAVRTSYQEKINGWLTLHQCDRYRQWKSEEIELLESVADSVGIALAQVQLLKQEITRRNQLDIQNQQLQAEITERQKQRQELEIAKSKAEVASLAKSEFLAKMTHELRTPLNAILGFTQLMCRDSTTTSEQKEILSIINSSGEHLLSLISDVLEMSKIEAGKTTLQCLDCDLNRLLNSLFAMLQIKAKSKGINLIFNLAPDLPPCIKIDEGKLRQILINLLSNAIKFTAQGTVTLTVNSQLMTPRTSSAGFTRGRVNLAPRPLALRGWGQPLTKADSLGEQALFFTLQDTGVGIAPEELKNLFQTFRQTKSGKNLGEGTGLGLAISQRFIQMMDGQISVESQVNRGTKFEFMIPVKMGSLQQVKYLEQQKDRQVVSLAAEQPDYKILIVEDQWENRRILHQLLNSIGFITKEAINGQQAINIAQSWQPDLILMDLELPILNGYQTTKKIKQQMTTKCPIIIAITANAFDEERQKMLSVGCDDFMAKPFQAENLFEVLAHHLKLQYIYEKSSDITLVSPAQHNELSPTAIKSQLTQMSPEWRDQIEEAAIALDRTLVLQLITEIPDSARDLATTFQQWVEDFRFDKIPECLKN